jgi:glycerophosphoryl diester phosphodiesterase
MISAVQRHRLFAALLVGTALLAACGDDESGAGTSDTPATPSTAADVSTTTSTAPPDTAAVVIAHRGASAYAPEHTIPAYDLAREQGADYIELDLQMTADGVLVSMHDTTLDRTAQGPAESCTGDVSARTLAEIQQCDVGSWFNQVYPDAADPAYAGLQIPTVEEVFERFGTEVRYYIETKAPEAQPGMEEELLRLLDEAGITDQDPASRPVIIQSFSADSLRLIHSLRPELPLVQLVSVVGPPIDEALLDDISEYAVGIGPAKELVDPALVEAAHARCLDVHPYTVDDPAEMARLLTAGVDGMFTNVPDRLLDERTRQPDPPTHCRPGE